MKKIILFLLLLFPLFVDAQDVVVMIKTTLGDISQNNTLVKTFMTQRAQLQNQKKGLVTTQNALHAELEKLEHKKTKTAADKTRTDEIQQQLFGLAKTMLGVNNQMKELDTRIGQSVEAISAFVLKTGDLEKKLNLQVKEQKDAKTNANAQLKTQAAYSYALASNLIAGYASARAQLNAAQKQTLATYEAKAKLEKNYTADVQQLKQQYSANPADDEKRLFDDHKKLIFDTIKKLLDQVATVDKVTKL